MNCNSGGNKFIFSNVFFIHEINFYLFRTAGGILLTIFFLHLRALQFIWKAIKQNIRF
jgi:hypothetical protein